MRHGGQETRISIEAEKEEREKLSRIVITIHYTSDNWRPRHIIIIIIICSIKLISFVLVAF